MSFGPNRTKNAEAQKYINNILSSGHGSVLEHAQYTFLLYGADRLSPTSWCATGRASPSRRCRSATWMGTCCASSSVPSTREDAELHDMFLSRIDRVTAEYNEMARILTAKQASGLDPALSSEKKTEMRKKVNQAARSCLPNETEAPIVFSGNIRALRHVCEMRAAGAADVPIREVTTRHLPVHAADEPTLFADYKLYELPGGTHAVATDWRKV